MATRACIQLEKDANEATRARFFEAIDLLTNMFESGAPLAGYKKRSLSKPYISNSENDYPVSVIAPENSTRDIVCFSITRTDYVAVFESLARLHMERKLVGNKYRIIVSPEPIDA